MEKNTSLLGFLLISITIYSQVGINTKNAKDKIEFVLVAMLPLMILLIMLGYLLQN